MATNKELEQKLKLLREEEAIRNRLDGKKIPSPYDNRELQEIIKSAGGIESAMKAVEEQTKSVRASIRNLKDGVTEFKDLSSAITEEFGRMDKATTKVARSYRKINSIAEQLSEVSLDLVSVNRKDVVKLKEKADLEFKKLKTFNRQLHSQKELVKADIQRGDLSGKALKNKEEELKRIDNAISASNDDINLARDKDDAFGKVLGRVDSINKSLGITGATLKGTGKLVSKLGFGNLAEHFDKGAVAAKKLAVKIHENDESLTKFQKRFPKTATMIEGLSVSLGGALKAIFTDPLTLLVSLGTALVKSFTHLDHAVAKVGKNLGLSNESATKLTFELKAQAVASDEMGVSMDRLIGAQLEISKSLGTNVKLTGQQLEDQVYLAEFAGMQGEALVNAYKASTLLGKSSESMYDSILATNDTIFQTKELFEDAVNTTGQIATNLGNNPVAIARAVGEAKRLGITLDTARSMADSTLDFESSIAAEMEAQVLTGKSINLNNARQLAFQGDHLGAAKEMLKQVGSLEEFSNMNVLAQQSLAKAMGLSTDELADQLKDAEINNKLTARRNQLIAEGMQPEEARLKALDENRTIGETINDIATRLKDIFGSLVKGPLTQVRKLLSNTDGIVEKIKEGFLAAFKGTKEGGKNLASMVPTAAEIAKGAENIGKFFGNAVNFISSIPDKLKGLAENPIFQFISSLFGENGTRNLAIAGGVGVLGKMLLGRGSRMNPMYVTMGKGGLIQKSFDTLKNIFTKKGTQSLAKQAGAKGAGAIMKATGKKVYGAAATSAVKAGTAGLAKTGGKSVAKQAGKIGAKALGKSILKKIPGVGLLAGVGFGLQRALSGDFAGAALELASGAASTIPGIGTAASLAADAALVARDISRANKLNELQQTVDAPAGTQEIPVTDFVIKPLQKDTISMAGGTKLGGNVEALLETLIQEVRKGGDVVMDGRKVGTTLQLASYKL